MTPEVTKVTLYTVLVIPASLRHMTHGCLGDRVMVAWWYMTTIFKTVGY